MGVSKKQVSLKRLYLHGQKSGMTNTVQKWETVALGAVDIFRLGSAKHKNLKARGYTVTTRHVSLLSALLALGKGSCEACS